MFDASLPDIPRLYTAIAEWIACIVCIYPLRKHLDYSKVGGTVLLLAGQILLQSVVGQWPLVLWIPGMITNILWMALTIYLLADISKSMLVLFVVRAFLISELMASLTWQVYTMIFWNTMLDSVWIEVLNGTICLAILAGAVFWLDSRINYQRLANAITLRNVVIFTVAGILIFTMSNIGFLLTQTTHHLGNSTSVFLVRTVVNISGFCLLYLLQYQVIDQNRRSELDAIQNVFQLQYQQYRAFAENTQYINRKAHDLKHQIQVILAEDDTAIRQRYLADLSHAIENLNYKIETGNGVLDAILTRKNMYCQENKINFTCIANGALLHSLEIMDICSLFGNALDNAIEHVEKIEDIEKRLVTLKLLNKGKMVILRVDNYCIDESIDMKSLPKTSKANKESHGYGLKNIQYIAKKYGGNMTIELNDNWFSLCVIFPIV